jgi:hypothetical protein
MKSFDHMAHINIHEAVGKKILAVKVVEGSYGNDACRYALIAVSGNELIALPIRKKPTWADQKPTWKLPKKRSKRRV